MKAVQSFESSGFDYSVLQHLIPEEWNPEVRISFPLSFFCRITNMEHKVQAVLSLKSLKLIFTVYLLDMVRGCAGNLIIVPDMNDSNMSAADSF
jgi:hypothetical protein